MKDEHLDEELPNGILKPSPNPFILFGIHPGSSRMTSSNSFIHSRHSAHRTGPANGFDTRRVPLIALHSPLRVPPVSTLPARRNAQNVRC